MTARWFHIGGAGRSGTSLMTGLIDAHPSCTVVPETLSKSLLHSGEGEPRERIARYLEACDGAAREAAPLLWGHKSPTEHVLPLGEDGALQFLEATKNIPCVFMLRDGRTCVVSKMRRKGLPLEKAIALWKYSVWYLERLRETGCPLLVVKYEDLVADPVKELRRVSGFLGIEYDERMLAGTTSEKMQPAYRRAGFDPPAEVGPSQEWFASLQPELIVCGYSYGSG